jgi:hypothetical protein
VAREASRSLSARAGHQVAENYQDPNDGGNPYESLRIASVARDLSESCSQLVTLMPQAVIESFPTFAQEACSG